MVCTPVLLPGKSHGQRSLVGCSPWGRWESDTTERLPFHFSLSRIGEGNGNPLQCSCLENPRDGGAWWASIYGVAQSRTRLKWLSSSSKLSPKGDQSWVLIGRFDVEAETPILWPPDAKSWLIWKDPWCWERLKAGEGDDRGRQEKEMTEDEMVGWHHRLNGHEFGWAPGVGIGQGGLALTGLQRVGHDWATELNWNCVSIMLFFKKQNKTKIRKVKKNKQIRWSLQEAQYQNKRRFQRNQCERQIRSQKFPRTEQCEFPGWKG